MPSPFNRHGMMLVTSMSLMVLLTALGGAMLLRGINEENLAERNRDAARAFQLAEAGIDAALVRLLDPVLGYWDSCDSFGTLEYTVACAKLDPIRTLSSTGTFTRPSGQTISKQVEVQVQRFIPPNFYDKVIYAADTLILKGDAYSLVGDVLTGNTDPILNTGNVIGTITQDPAASPLPKLDFKQLYAIASLQGNVYDADRLAKIQNHQDAFPSQFCYSPPVDPNDPSTCQPNVNYVTTDLVLNGNIGTIGGFFVVVGNVLTDPNATEDATLNGNGQVDGGIYTTGQFLVNGGGNGFNVDGGLWAGTNARLNGSVVIEYNATYMEAIKNLKINPDIQLLLWRECPPAGCA